MSTFQATSRRSVVGFTGAVIAFVVGGTACSSTAQNNAASSGDGGSASAALRAPKGFSCAALKKPKKKPASITIRIQGGNTQAAVADVAGKAFTQKTGVAIKWDNTDEAISYAKLGRQMKAGQRPSADASINAGQRTHLDGLRGFNVPICRSLVPNLDKAAFAAAAPPGTSQTADSWNYVNVWSVTVPFMVRKDQLDPSTIKSWKDLTKPDLRKSLAIDSIYSTAAFGVADELGVEPTNDPKSLDPVWEFSKKLKPNIAVRGSFSEVVQALVTGRVKVGISGVAAGINAQKAGADVAFVAPESGTYIVSNPYSIHKGIPDENLYYAQLFANYLLSLGAQENLASAQYYLPIRPDAAMPKFMTENPKIFPVTEEQLKQHAIIAPIPVMAANDAPWQSEWDRATS